MVEFFSSARLLDRASVVTLILTDACCKLDCALSTSIISVSPSSRTERLRFMGAMLVVRRRMIWSGVHVVSGKLARLDGRRAVKSRG